MTAPWTLESSEERALNDFEAAMKDHAGKYHYLAEVDPEAADEELYQMAYLLVERVEWREKRRQEDAERRSAIGRQEQEVSIPVIGGGY